MTDAVEIIGLLKIRDHCLFTWREPERERRRIVEIRSEHCEQCIAELYKMAVGWTLIDRRGKR